jgi:hypothetical protein
VSGTQQAGAVLAFLTPFVGAYVLYRVVFAVVELKDPQRARAERSQQKLEWDRFVAHPLSWIMVADALDTYRLTSLEEWRERCR